MDMKFMPNTHTTFWLFVLAMPADDRTQMPTPIGWLRGVLIACSGSSCGSWLAG